MQVKEAIDSEEAWWTSQRSSTGSPQRWAEPLVPHGHHSSFLNLLSVPPDVPPSVSPLVSIYIFLFLSLCLSLSSSVHLFVPPSVSYSLYIFLFLSLSLHLYPLSVPLSVHISFPQPVCPLSVSQHGRPEVVEPTLQRWIGDSAAIPCTPDVQAPKAKKKSPRWVPDCC